LSRREQAQIEDAIGPITDLPLLLAVRDGRGRQFQRLEFLGDSVLDVMLATHRWVELGAGRGERVVGPEVASDRRLAQHARKATFGQWLEWRASDERLADLIETCLAACWLSGGWPQAEAMASRVVHPIGAETLNVLVSGEAELPAGRIGRRAAAAIFELAGAHQVYSQFPQASEGELSQRRATIHRTDVIARAARQLGEEYVGDDETVMAAVEDVVATALSQRGADAALQVAAGFMGAH
jgi:dsRNA-specific ribonuclease